MFESITGYDLLHQGSLALSKAEDNGFRVDVEGLRREKLKADRMVEDVEACILSKKIGKKWKRKYGSNFNFDSNKQIGDVLFNMLGLDPVKITKKTEQPSVDRDSLVKMDHPLCVKLVERTKLKDLSVKFIGSILREVNDDDFLRPNFNLNTVSSYRSSSSDPNGQNFPKRDKVLSKVIRSHFLPRKGRRLVEIDFGSLEVRVSACYHKDPTMIDYLLGGGDMHTDSARDIYLLDHDDVSSDTRYAAKNRFVFPEFYGSYWEKVAPALWESIEELDLETVGGIPLDNWLLGKGIKCYEDFEAHIRNVEDIFWNERFPVYDQWKRDFYADYQTRGWFSGLTGFKYRGPFTRNQVTNMPVQGSAFHCLLWSFIHIQKEIERRDMKTKLVGQVHDSVIGDVPDEEFDDFVELSLDITRNQLPKVWDWIIVPLEVDVEYSEVNGNWFEMNKMEEVA